MTNEIERMTDREADAAVAEEVMGREVQRFDSGRIREYDGKRHASGGWSWQSLPHYSTDDTCARLMRNRIAELGVADKFISELVLVCDSSRWGGTWDLLQATPRHQVNAALRAVRGRKG